MNTGIDTLARSLATGLERRKAIKSLGALGLGALGLAGVARLEDNAAEAKSCKKNSDCPDGKTCKNKKKQNNGKRRGRCK